MEVHVLVKKSDGVGSGAMRVARLRYFAAVLHRCQRSSVVYSVNADSGLSAANS